MATAAAPFPAANRRLRRNQPATGRASYPEIYFVKHIDNSRLRREVDLEKRSECFSLLGLGAVVFLFMMLFAWQHFQCVRYGYQIEQLKQQQASLEEWNHALKIESASLADPQRIDTLARSQLGLVPPKPDQVIQVGNGPGSLAQPSDTEFAGNMRVPTGILNER